LVSQHTDTQAEVTTMWNHTGCSKSVNLARVSLAAHVAVHLYSVVDGGVVEDISR
jgi:hypothetical protein